MLRPTRDQLLVENLEESKKSTGGIDLLYRQGIYSRKRVLAVGPDVYGGIEVGDILWVPGNQSGVKIDDNKYIISEEICAAVEENENGEE